MLKRVRLGMEALEAREVPAAFSFRLADGTVGTASATVAFDAADTQATFELSDGTGGTLSYDVPWASVDATQASQSVSLSNFVLNIAGQNLTPTTADFTTSPTAQFAHGVLTGITFAIDTSGLAAFPYVAVSMSGLQASAQPPMIPPALPGLPPVVPPPVVGAVNARPTITLDFSTATAGQAYRIDLVVKDPSGNVLVSAPINIGAGATTQDIRDTIADVLGDSGLEIVTTGDNKLRIVSKGNKKLGAITYNTLVGTTPAPTLKGPKVISMGGGASLSVNGTTLNP